MNGRDLLCITHSTIGEEFVFTANQILDAHLFLQRIGICGGKDGEVDAWNEDVKKILTLENVSLTKRCTSAVLPDFAGPTTTTLTSLLRPGRSSESFISCLPIAVSLQFCKI